jgi:hypothetical protein
MTAMKKCLIILLLLYSIRLIGQESSVYRYDGKLRIDTSYLIEPDRINDFLKIEKFVLPNIYNRLIYPSSSKSSVEGLVIARVTITNNITIKLIRTVDETTSKSVLYALDTSLLKKELANIKKPFVFYLPFKFVILNDSFLEDLKNYNSVVIRASPGTKYYEKIGWITKDSIMIKKKK